MTTRFRAQLELDAELYDHYAEQATKINSASRNGHVSAETLMVAQLLRFAHVPPSERILVVDAENREKLEHLLSGGALRDGADLYEKAQRLADVQIGGIRCEFSPAQLSQLKRYATRNQVTPEEALKRVVKQMESQFFDWVSD